MRLRLAMIASVRSCRERRHGFTLIELMVVLILMGIVTAVIVPEMKGTYEEALLRSTSRELADVFNIACCRAVSLDQLHRVRIDRQTGRYLVERRRNNSLGREFLPVRDLPGGEGKIDSRIAIDIRRPGEDSSRTTDDETASDHDQEKWAGDRDGAIAFYPDGTADARDILLRDRDGFRLVLRINPITARVQIIELKSE